MGLECKKEVLGKLKKRFGNNIKLPQNISIQREDNKYQLILKASSVKNENMQMAQNAFEGWALAIYECYRKEAKECVIELGLDEYTENSDTLKGGHENRFLYRAMRFAEQYKWFTLSEQLGKEVQKWKYYIENEETLFINNVGKGEAGNKTEHKLENEIEAKLAEQDGKLNELLKEWMEFGKNPIFRQLPVGLFRAKTIKDIPEKNNMVFTGAKSAIDLWSWNEKEFHVVELKANNSMIGIVTEIFFYANYMRDLLLENGLFTINEAERTVGGRGYEYIQKNKYFKINGIMLADVFHSLVKDGAILELMNDNETDELEYYLAEYTYEPIVQKR